MREFKFRMWTKGFDYFDIGDEKPIPTDAVIEQFTGLVDKNGRDIYEGDIIPWKTILGEVFNGVVKYADKWAQFYLSVRNNVGGGAAMDSTFIWYYGEDGKVIAEVIGNIHENPKLVPEK